MERRPVRVGEVGCSLTTEVPLLSAGAGELWKWELLLH